MEISIIINTLNRISELENCLNSIDKQDYSSFEIIVVDQNTTLPGIEEIVNKYNNTIYYKFEKNLGPSIARNFAAKKAKGKYLLFVDDDAILIDSSILSKVIDKASTNNFGQIGCQVYADEEGKKLHHAQCVINDDGFLNVQKSKNNNLDLSKERVTISTCFCFIKKNVFFEVGGFDPVFFFYDEDTDLSLRVQSLGYKYYYYNDLKIFHVSGNETRSPNSRYFNKNYLVLKNFGYFIYLKNFIKDFLYLLFSFSYPRFLDQLNKLKFQINLISNLKYINLRKKMDFLNIDKEYEKKNRQIIRKFLENVENIDKTKSKNNNKTAFVYITNRCNARCEHCFYWEELNKEVDEMSLQDYKNLAKTFENDVNQVIITGGEPFLRKDIDIISKYFLQNKYIHSLNFITNGVLPERIEEKVIKIMKYSSKNTKILVNVSIDGLNELHDQIRRVPGIFEKCLDTISRLKKIKSNFQNLQISALTTIQKDNFSQFVDINKYVEKELEIYHRINIIRSPKTGAFRLSKNVIEDGFNPDWVKPFELMELNSEEHKKVLDYFMNKNNWKDYHKFVLYYSYYIKKNKAKFFDCSAPNDNLVIYPNGDLAFCEYTKSFTNVKNAKNFKDFWETAKANEFRKFLKACSCDHPCNIGGNLAKNNQLSNILPKWENSPSIN